MKLLKVTLLFIVMLFATSGQVLAVDIPNFPVCSNPEGSLIASYDSGTHGVAGGTSYSGSDKVYKINNETLIQCLCASDGKGIQTNWWKASSLDENQINTLKSEGWIYIPNGTVWGLDDSAYVAKNVDYSCISNGTGGSSTSSTNSSIGQVLGLAFTGNIKLIYGIFALGILSLVYGQILHRARN